MTDSISLWNLVRSFTAATPRHSIRNCWISFLSHVTERSRFGNFVFLLWPLQLLPRPLDARLDQELPNFNLESDHVMRRSRFRNFIYPPQEEEYVVDKSKWSTEGCRLLKTSFMSTTDLILSLKLYG